MSKKAPLRASLIAGLLCAAALAQDPPPPPPPQDYPPPARLAPQQLDQIVERIALYPDPLLAQILTGSTYWNEIADASAWANQHSYLHGDELSRAIYDDNLSFDPSVLALLPFPGVLDMMARDPAWTQALGNSVLAQRPEVMDAVQRMRQKAMDYGYLESNAEYRVVAGVPGDIEILPVNPGYVYVPFYDPLIVFGPPRPGFFIGGAIRFGPGIYIGAFAPFGWAGAVLGWRTHEIFFDHRPWERTWVNRGNYVHSYAVPYRRPAAPRVERHERREERRR